MNTNNNSTDNAITHAFQQIEITLNQKLKKDGYKILHQEQDEHSSENNSVIWIDEKKALRLRWDPIEKRFILESSDTMPVSSITVWDDIILAPFDPHKHDEHYVVTIAGEFVDSLDWLS